jgi:hypothetical protein
MRIRLLALVLLVLPAGAQAITVLTSGKSFSQRDGFTVVRVGSDAELATLSDPTACPSAVTLRIAAYPTARNLVIGPPPVALPCEGWRPIANGWLYRDEHGSAGGIRRVQYTTRGLTIVAAAPGFVAEPGPVGFVQVGLTVGTTRYHVRFHTFQRNDAAAIVSTRASRLAAETERAFWQTLLGSRDRSAEVLRLAAAGEARAPRDGRLPFLAAMMHLYEFGAQVTHYPSATPAQRTHIDAARDAFARALPLLYQSGVGDTRALGFASGTTYVAAVLNGDPLLRQQAIDEMNAAAVLNPLFNAFNPIGVVPPAVAPNDPAYAGALQLLDEYFPVAAVDCVMTAGVQGELCFNDGLAPHNLEGTFLFFGDVYAKAGRLDDARSRYETARAVGQANGWRPEFLADIDERLTDLPARIARFQDADPNNDPPLIGVANSGCAHCHYQ